MMLAACSNTMISTLPGNKAAQGCNLLHGCFAVSALLSPLLLVFFAGHWPAFGWRVMAGLLLADGVGIQAGMGVVAALTALLPASIVLSETCVDRSQ